MYFEENLDRDALAVYFRHGYIQSIFLNMKELEVGISQRLQRNAVPEQMFKNSEEESADESSLRLFRDNRKAEARSSV